MGIGRKVFIDFLEFVRFVVGSVLDIIGCLRWVLGKWLNGYWVVMGIGY